MSFEFPDTRRDEDECGCRSSATCPEHLAEADLTLAHVPMGAQARPACWVCRDEGCWLCRGESA